MTSQGYKVNIRPITSSELKEFKQQYYAQSKMNGVENGMQDITSSSGLQSPPLENQDCQLDLPNKIIQVKNLDTLDEYQIKAQVNPELNASIDKWIEKRKYRVDETINDLQVVFGGIYPPFCLQKSAKTDAELIKEELNELKKEKLMLMREHKLFMHYYFQFWDEKMRKNILSKNYLIDTIVESAQNLYDQHDGLAFVEDGERGSKRYYLGFKQPNQFLTHSGNNQRVDELILRQQGFGGNQFRQPQVSTYNYMQQNLSQYPVGEEQFEVFITGKGVPHSLAQISSRYYKRQLAPTSSSSGGKYGIEDVTGQDSEPLYLHKVNVQLIKGSTYNVYTPKFF